MSAHLTEEELLDSFEKGEWISQSNLDISKRRVGRAIAKPTIIYLSSEKVGFVPLPTLRDYI
jgi:hypothetical protein